MQCVALNFEQLIEARPKRVKPGEIERNQAKTSAGQKTQTGPETFLADARPSLCSNSGQRSLWQVPGCWLTL